MVSDITARRMHITQLPCAAPAKQKRQYEITCLGVPLVIIPRTGTEVREFCVKTRFSFGLNDRFRVFYEIDWEHSKVYILAVG